MYTFLFIFLLKKNPGKNAVTTLMLTLPENGISLVVY